MGARRACDNYLWAGSFAVLAGAAMSRTPGRVAL